MARFKPGQSGNPSGRPPGIPNPNQRLRMQIADELPEIVNAMVEAAKGGDVSAASLLLGRVLPPVRPESPTHELPDAGSMTERAERIVTEAMAGNISPTTAGELMTVLSNQARIVEVTEIKEELAQIKAALGIKDQ